MKRVLYVDFPRDIEMNEPPQDGRYAVISHNPGFNGRNRLAPNPFPWRTTIYDFKAGEADEIASGSNAGDMLSRYDVAKAFLIGLLQFERAALDNTLKKFDIELIEDPVAVAEKERSRNSFVPGFLSPLN